jgi:hypothetical protein
MVEAPAKKVIEISDTINVSSRRDFKFFVDIGKKSLEKFETVTLHALGNAISTSVIAAENLVK